MNNSRRRKEPYIAKTDTNNMVVVMDFRNKKITAICYVPDDIIQDAEKVGQMLEMKYNYNLYYIAWFTTDNSSVDLDYKTYY